jgi:lysophospholipase L1-like esterase
MATDIIARGLALRSSAGSDLSIYEFMQREGFFLGNTYTSKLNFTPSAGEQAPSGISLGMFPMPPVVGRAYYIENIFFTCNKNARFMLALGGPVPGTSGLGSVNLEYIPFGTTPYSTVVLPVRRIISPSYEQTVILNYLRFYDTDLTGTDCVAGMTGFDVTDDLNLDAPNVILCVGDSIFYGLGPTSKDNHLLWQARRLYRETLTTNARLSVQAITSQQSTGSDAMRARGRYEIRNPSTVKLILWMQGANDALSGTATATFTQAAKNFIDWKKQVYPKAHLVMLGQTPLQDAASEARAALQRTALQTLVATYSSDPLVRFCDLGGSFTATDSTKYSATDPAGSGRHPNDAGGALVSSTLTAWLQTNVPTL